MKKSFKIFAIIVIIYFVGNTLVKSVANAAIEREKVTIEQECKLLWDYYYSTENLLNKLEEEYQWVDAIEDYDYYDAVEALYENNLLIEE